MYNFFCPKKNAYWCYMVWEVMDMGKSNLLKDLGTFRFFLWLEGFRRKQRLWVLFKQSLQWHPLKVYLYIYLFYCSRDTNSIPTFHDSNHLVVYKAYIRYRNEENRASLVIGYRRRVLLTRLKSLRRNIWAPRRSVDRWRTVIMTKVESHPPWCTPPEMRASKGLVEGKVINPLWAVCWYAPGELRMTTGERWIVQTWRLSHRCRVQDFDSKLAEAIAIESEILPQPWVENGSSASRVMLLKHSIRRSIIWCCRRLSRRFKGIQTCMKV